MKTPDTLDFRTYCMVERMTKEGRTWRMIYELILLFALLAICSSLDAQINRLKGSYYEDNSMWAYERNYFSFYENGTFTYHKTSDFGEFFGAGRFIQTKDSIRFEFTPSIEAQNTAEIFEAPADSLCQVQGISVFRAVHALNAHVPMMLSYQLFRGDSLISQGGESPFGVLKITVQEGDSLSLTATDWGNTWLGYSMIIKSDEPKSYVLSVPMRVAIVEPNINETMGYRLKKSGKKLILIRKGRANFFHPDADRKVKYLRNS